jgi:hypothetical protein
MPFTDIGDKSGELPSSEEEEEEEEEEEAN